MRPYSEPCSHPVTQHLFLHGIITDETCIDVYSALVQGPEPPARCFTLHISSNGGDCDAAFALVHAILHSRFCVTTVGAGSVASAALDVFISGHIRNMSKSATVLMHSASIGGMSSVSRKALKELEAKRAFALWRECTDVKTREHFDRIFTRSDKWVAPSYLQSLGAVDNLL